MKKNNQYDIAKKRLFQCFIDNFDEFEKNANELLIELTALSLLHDKDNLSNLFFKSLKFNELINH